MTKDLKGRAESRWQCGKTQSLLLPTTRAPAGHWWGTLRPKEMGGTPKEMGGTPKWTTRTWGDWERRRSGGWTEPVHLRGGWDRGGVPTSGGTLGDSDQRGARPAYLIPNQPGKSARFSGQVLHPQRFPPGRVDLGGIGERPGENRRSRWEGPSRTRGAREECWPFPLGPGKPAGLPGGVSRPLRPEAGRMPGPFCSVEPKPHHPHPPRHFSSPVGPKHRPCPPPKPHPCFGPALQSQGLFHLLFFLLFFTIVILFYLLVVVSSIFLFLYSS